MINPTMVHTGAAMPQLQRRAHWWTVIEERLVENVEDRDSERDIIRGSIITLIICCVLASVEHLVKGTVNSVIPIVAASCGTYLFTTSRAAGSRRTPSRKEVQGASPALRIQPLPERNKEKE